MSKEQVNENLVYIVEEEDDEEETVTIDFENETIYQKEEHLIVKTDNLMHTTMSIPGETQTFSKDFNEDLRIKGGQFSTMDLKSRKPSFQNELQDLLLNSVTSKAVSSLLSKHYELDTDLDKTLYNKRRMGELTDLIATDVQAAMDKRRQELKACFIGGQVRYEKIPQWAKSYVREYIQNMVHGLSILVEDGE